MMVVVLLEIGRVLRVDWMVLYVVLFLIVFFEIMKVLLGGIVLL